MCEEMIEYERRYYARLIGLVALLSIFPFIAEARTSSASQTDSLYLALPSMREYFVPGSINTPQPLIDCQDAALAYSPVVAYLLHEAKVRPYSSILSHRLLLPLVIQYQNLGQRTSLPSLSEGILPWDRVNLAGPYTLSLPQFWHDLGISTLLDRTLSVGLRRSHVGLFSYGAIELMGNRELMRQAETTINIPKLFAQDVETGRMKILAENLVLQEIGNKYWVPSFESSIQFSQNYVSDNWHKGGSSNLNLYMRTYFALLYTKNNLRWNNELEDKLSLYRVDGMADKRYRISEDLIRLRSNLGIKASKRWLYTLDAELRTQLFPTYSDDRAIVRSDLWSPMTTNVGLGMQFNYGYKGRRVYARKFSFSANLAPISHTYRYSRLRDIDLARHGLSMEAPYYHRFGSTIRANLQWDFSMDISWTSRLYFNTSYTNVEAEWENTLTMRIGRYLSTRVNLHLRYDDSVSPRGETGWRRFVQVNELLSFGFNYRI